MISGEWDHSRILDAQNSLSNNSSNHEVSSKCPQNQLDSPGLHRGQGKFPPLVRMEVMHEYRVYPFTRGWRQLPSKAPMSVEILAHGTA